MTAAAAVSLILLAGGAAFFLAGTVGLLRFPDLYARLHAVTKADNLGLGLMVAGLIVQAESMAVVGKLLAVWLLALVASASSAYLIASSARRQTLRGTGAADRRGRPSGGEGAP